MKLAFGNGLRVLLGVVIATVLHGCGDIASSAPGENAQITVSIPYASSNRAARTVVAPGYIKTYTITVYDVAENVIVPSRKISADGGEVSLTVPPNTALHVIGAALDEGNNERFRGDKAVPPIAVGAKASVSLTLDALAPLSSSLQAADQGPLIAVENVKEVTVITTNAQPDQQVSFSISGGADQNLFNIVSIVSTEVVSAQLSFNNPPSVGEYEVQVKFTDGNDFESVVQDLKVKVVVKSGGLDVGFGPDGNGIVIKDFGSPPAVVSYDSATAVVVQSDGNIVVAGTTSAGSALVRYTRDGILDETFGTRGIVTLSGVINAMALRGKDEIIVAGTTTNTGGTDFLLAHYDMNGNIDFGFGNIDGGVVTTDIANGSYDSAAALVIQADGKIVVVGSMDNSALAAIANSSNIAVVRYDAQGVRDTTFGSNKNGIVVADVVGATRSYATAVTLQGDSLQPSGKIIVAGYGTFQVTGNDFVIVRYDNVGIPDSSFNTDGIVTTDFASDKQTTSDDQATGVVIQPDGTPEGKIVVVGSSYDTGFELARYKNDGTLDSDFGSEGKVPGDYSVGEFAHAIVLQPDGKLVVGGAYDSCGDCNVYFGVVRYNVNGSLDTSFGANGNGSSYIRGPVGTYYSGAANALALQPDGKIVAVGDVYGTTPQDFGIVRFNP